MQIVRWLDLRPEAWRNGGGTTREIWRQAASGGDARGVEGFDWRASVAEVETAGPFSLFPGHVRVIMPLSAHGMLLRSADQSVEQLTPLVPFSFSGDAAMAAELPHGPVTDFNFIVRRGFADAAVTLYEVSAGSDCMPPPGTCLVFVVSGHFIAGGTEMGWRDSLVLTPPESIRFSGQGKLACCQLVQGVV